MLDEENGIFNEIKEIIAKAGYSTDMLLDKKLKGNNAVKVGDQLMCRISCKSKLKYLQIRQSLLKTIQDNNLMYTTETNDSKFLRLPLKNGLNIEGLKVVIIKAFVLAYRGNADMSFGCCSRYVECSDLKNCINPDSTFALGCLYRVNLENGKIFYGKNKNIV